MSNLIDAIVLVAMLAALAKGWGWWRTAQRLRFIRTYSFPDGLLERLGKHHPHLDGRDRHLVARGLRQFFIAYLRGGRKFVSMPSQAVDDLWHEFILYTRHYQAFCRKAFGRFLHHTPAAVLGANRESNAGLRRVWWHSCREEKIDPKKTTRLPLLFALDQQLKLENGFRYALDCHRPKRQGQDSSSAPVYCAGDMSSTAFDGSSDGFGDSWFGGSDGDGGDSSCGGGCGGD
ncbi:hypothetical protein G3480_10635 [Thiorhodococcus mannitoliphagus]|uniref:Uncharacterized protein n=1 Tax=Thiorhodococcus mannitoliphagus TaxID=329406 RepID=A0A6P1DUV5_9GAMM|nr:hypothetical protein [Thiorhodococcus mannitoliphagus]NEX20761.1 hypothetical protein [Thiorhodococcus mannitoliphagus]